MAYVGFLVVLVLGILLLWCSGSLLWYQLALGGRDRKDFTVIGGIALAGVGLLYWAVVDAPFKVTLIG